MGYAKTMREINESENFIELADDLRRLMASQQTLLLATASPEDLPDISYAPFIRDLDGHFYIFISELATHTANLQRNPKASVMLIRPESESGNLFARERAVFQCRVKEINQNETRYSLQLDMLQDRFGPVVNLLRSLPDFHLFELCPESGRYIAGFGRAFRISIEDGSVSSLATR
jgi:putative heme iron utilization protein